MSFIFSIATALILTILSEFIVYLIYNRPSVKELKGCILKIVFANTFTNLALNTLMSLFSLLDNGKYSGISALSVMLVILLIIDIFISKKEKRKLDIIISIALITTSVILTALFVYMSAAIPNSAALICIAIVILLIYMFQVWRISKIWGNTKKMQIWRIGNVAIMFAVCVFYALVVPSVIFLIPFLMAAEGIIPTVETKLFTITHLNNDPPGKCYIYSVIANAVSLTLGMIFAIL